MSDKKQKKPEKYRVVGWTYYENDLIESGPIDDEVVEAVIEDIRENGYLFTGYHHQEHYDCAPVMNDGMRRLFSRRQFGAIMAKAHGDEGEMAYSWYMDDYGIRPEALVFPETERDYSVLRSIVLDEDADKDAIPPEVLEDLLRLLGKKCVAETDEGSDGDGLGEEQ